MKKTFLLFSLLTLCLGSAFAQTKKEGGNESLDESSTFRDQSRALLLFIERCYNDISGEELVIERERAASIESKIGSLEKKQPAEPDCMSDYCDNIYFTKVNIEKIYYLLDNKEKNPNYREMVLPLAKGEEFTVAKAHVDLNTQAIQNYKSKIEKGPDYSILIGKTQETLTKGLTYINGEIAPGTDTESDLIRSILQSNLSLKNLQ